MNIYLLDINSNMIDAWKNAWENPYKDRVYAVNGSFQEFIYSGTEIDAIVSPGNSFGIMDGGYDKAIIECFGPELMKDVQNKIKETWYGEQPAGTSLSVCAKNLEGERYYLIHTPTMRIPEEIKDWRIAYQCMRSALIEAKRLNCKSIVIPAFGGCTGKVPYDAIARMMYLAYEKTMDRPDKIDWTYAIESERRLREEGYGR